MSLQKRLYTTGLTWLWVTVFLIALDRYTKTWTVENLNLLEPFQILPFFNLTLAYNTGAAFSFLNSASGWQNVFLGSLAVVISTVILYSLHKISVRQYWINIALCLILGGALGNAFDRTLYGYVIDFFDFHWGAWHFAIFNIADSAICVGTAMLIWHWIRQKETNPNN